MRTIVTAIAAAISISITAPAFAQGLPQAKPAEAGLAADRLERLTRAMEHDIASGRRVGTVVAVTRKGKAIYHKAFGLADRETNQQMRPDSIFRLHSQTKPIVSAGLLILMEEGHFSLNDPLAMHVPELANLKVQDGLNADGSIRTRAAARQPTMHDVLRHTTGWTGTVLDLFPDPVSQKLAKGELKRPNNLGQLVTALASEPLAYDPGAEWRYGPEHDLQGYLIEKFSGMKLADFLRTRIFEPLGMIDTGFSLPPEKLGRYTVMYAKKPDGSWAVFDSRTDSAYLADARDPRGGSGLTSTAADQMRFGQMLLNGGELDGKRILGRKTVDMMLMDQLPASVRGVGFGPKFMKPGERYGLGIGLYTDVAASGLIGSEGVAYWPGFSHTVMFIDRKEDMLILAMSQHQPSDQSWGDRVRSLAYQAVVD